LSGDIIITTWRILDNKSHLLQTLEALVTSVDVTRPAIVVVLWVHIVVIVIVIVITKKVTLTGIVRLNVMVTTVTNVVHETHRILGQYEFLHIVSTSTFQARRVTPIRFHVEKVIPISFTILLFEALQAADCVTLRAETNVSTGLGRNLGAATIAARIERTVWILDGLRNDHLVTLEAPVRDYGLRCWSSHSRTGRTESVLTLFAKGEEVVERTKHVVLSQPPHAAVTFLGTYLAPCFAVKEKDLLHHMSFFALVFTCQGRLLAKFKSTIEAIVMSREFIRRPLTL